MVKDNELKETTGKLLTQFHDSIREEQLNKFAAPASRWRRNHFLKPGCKPEDVYTFLASDMDGFKTALYVQLYPGSDSKVSAAYLAWGKIYRQLGHMMDDLFPGGGCQDRSRYLANCYVDYMKTGELPEFPDPESHFWVPPVGSPEEWMDLCDGVMKQELSNDWLFFTVALCKFLRAHPDLSER